MRGNSTRGWISDEMLMVWEAWRLLRHFSFLIWVFRLLLAPLRSVLGESARRERKVSHSIKILCSGRMSLLCDVVRIWLYRRRRSPFALSSLPRDALRKKNRIWFRVDKHFHVLFASLENYNWHFHPRSGLCVRRWRRTLRLFFLLTLHSQSMPIISIFVGLLMKFQSQLTIMLRKSDK